MNEIRKRKNDIRTHYKQIRAELDRDKKAAMDEAICSYFTTLATYRYASVLLMYAPKKDEVNVYPLAERALADGKKVAFPRCIEETHDMNYHFVEDLSVLEKGSYGLLEPPSHLPVYDCESKATAACIVPALVYDSKGYRLGYGKGYYDRYLSGFTGSKVGMIYTDFIIDQLPRGRFDLNVDFLVTEKGLRVLS